MKIKKNEFKTKTSPTEKVVDHIEKVLQPFIPQILSQQIEVLISHNLSLQMVDADWIMYQLVLFSILQNAVKYNKFKGTLMIIINCLPNNQPIHAQAISKKSRTELGDAFLHRGSSGFSRSFVLETEVIDTGIGIDSDRQKMLFIPFLELKIKQNLKQVKDYNIGVGLASSKAIVRRLGGDITLKQS